MPSLEKHPIPNLTFLQNALDQTQGEGQFDAHQWRERVRKRLQRLDMSRVHQDVLPFLERTAEAELLNHENLESLLN